MLWFQLYRMPQRDHADGFDLVRRAQSAGAQVLMITMDVPIRTKRPREVRRGLVLPFQMNARTVWDVVTSPAWLMSYMEHGLQRFSNYKPYVEAIRRRKNSRPTATRITPAAARSRGKKLDVIAMSGKARWSPRAFSIREDAIKAISMGCDGVVVSNHGGRQVEGLPSSVDVLPAIVEAIGNRATVLLDSGVRSGLDVTRGLALGANAAFAGKAFLYGLGAIGGEGAGFRDRHVQGRNPRHVPAMRHQFDQGCPEDSAAASGTLAVLTGRMR